MREDPSALIGAAFPARVHDRKEIVGEMHRRYLDEED